MLDDIVPETDSDSEPIKPKRKKAKTNKPFGWQQLRAQLRSAMGQARVLVFVHVEDEAKCLRVRGHMQYHFWTIAWLALARILGETAIKNLPECLSSLEACTAEHMNAVLSSLLAHVLLGHIREYNPLLSKMSRAKQTRLEQALSANVRVNIQSMCRQRPLPDFESWFEFHVQPGMNDATLQDLDGFSHVAKWTKDEEKHNMACDAFDKKVERATSISRLTTVRNQLKNTDDTTQLDQIKEELKQLNNEEKFMLRRMRKYRLFPTKQQQEKLRSFMGTCRWTYNQAVTHFRKTSESNAEVLRDLYVTKTSRKTRVYPEGMEPPPDWVFETPKTFRYNTLRKFQTNVKSAFSNLRNGNIKKFKIRYKSKKNGDRYFTFCEDGKNAKIVHNEDSKRSLLSISCLKDIPIRCDPGLEIKNEIQITRTNGYWYAVIPQFVRPSNYENEGRCIALDPGLKAFLTGVDLNGNAIHIGRDCRDRLQRLRQRISVEQQTMSKVKNERKEDRKTKKYRKNEKDETYRRRKQWRLYSRAKRAFDCFTAKMKNLVADMHYQACSYLTKNYDTIILPIFRTKEMLKRSCSRNHKFNESLMSLKHFQFRQLLAAKCEVLGKTLVVCSEMYTSMTCGGCDALHLKLGSDDVFKCPSCEHIAGRDVNAAFNILRFVCGGSLNVHNTW